MAQAAVVPTATLGCQCTSISHLEENLAASGWSIAPDDQKNLELFFADEDEWLQRRQLQSIRAILDQELTLQDGFSDLVYVLETLFELGLATEDAVLPVFQRLLALRKGQDRATIEPMREVQTELRDRFALDLTERTTSPAARL